MPFRPNPNTAAQAPGYAPSAAHTLSSHHHASGSAPPPVDSQPQDYHQQPPDGFHQSLGIEGQAAAATLISLHQPLPPTTGASSSSLLNGPFADDVDVSYTEDDSSSEGHFDHSMTDSDGGAGIGGSVSWDSVPQAAHNLPPGPGGNNSLGLPPVALASLQSAGLFFQMHGTVFGGEAGGISPMDSQGQFPWIAGSDATGAMVNPAATMQDALESSEQNDEDNDTDPPPPPVPQSNPHFGPLSPDNPGVLDFLTYWARLGNFSQNLRSAASRVPSVHQVTREAAKKRLTVRFDDLLGDEMDFQALNWKQMGITRTAARERRLLIYRNYVNAPGSDRWRPTLPDVALPNTESYFRFSRMDIRQNVHLSHFQLRNLLGCAGQSHAFYPGKKFVHHLNPLTGQSEAAMDLSDIFHVQISTLDANSDVVVAGTFTGEYCMKSVHSSDDSYGYTQGQITNNTSGITNHLQIHQARTSSSPRVAFSSNDQGFRIMDVETQKFILETQYPFPMNCSAISSDRRLRVMVGDSYETLIVNAESGEVIQQLFGHRDYGFACAWSDDGWTVATAAQDRGIKIWDARRWTDSSGHSTPVTTIRSEMAGVRGLRFSPAGSGPRVLVAAEEADFVNIIDAQTFRRKQTFDIFGEIGGVAFNNDGRTLNILCCDRNRGGLVQLDRYDYGSRFSFDEGSDYDISGFEPSFRTGVNPQPAHSGWGWKARSRAPMPKRRRLYLDDLQPF